MKRTRLRPQSAKRREEQKVRRELAAALRGQPCVLALPVCTGRAEHWHELVGAAQGGSRVDPRNLAPCADACNGWVEDNPAEAVARGMKVRAQDAMPGLGGLVPREPSPFALASLRAGTAEAWT